MIIHQNSRKIVENPPHAGAAHTPGLRIGTREHQKRTVENFELNASPHVHFLVLVAEVGGRWSDTCLRFVQQLAREKTWHIGDPTVRRLARATWMRRWWGILSVSLHATVAHSLLDFGSPVALPTFPDRTPALGTLFVRAPPPAGFSRVR